MNVLKFSDQNFAARLEQLAAASSLFDPVVEDRARGIVAAVRERGDAALLELTGRFDGAKLAAEQLAVSQAELFSASLAADDSLLAAVTEAEKNIAAFARKSLRKNWSARNSHGAVVGEKFDGFGRVGIYIPGGTAPLVSTALMTITLARVAGCREIAVCTPPGKDGLVNPALLFAARTAGATEIYKAGGAQAIAALALGTATIRPVQKVFGPGNAYVVAAKRLLVGHVAIDLLPGPSEVLVLADDTANPKFVAADLLAQAEHGSGHERVWLVTTSAKILKATEKEIARQLPTLSRCEFIAKALANNGWLIQVKSLADAFALVNQLAPEHCEVMIRQQQQAVEQITTAGALFLGSWSPTVLGDYVAGPSHTLPTGGAGRSFAGLTVDQFQRRTSVVDYSKPALKKALRAVQKFAELEGLDAHGKSASIRLD
ncbi:MAG: histidinol dehydrogenase [Limisphaerales bacterium]|nr:MAG: histidinol dehydrogenase [Limisphaerales bacterium]KAG0507749.1 MAG: histidinol dehydrogenase [Limisphaerales bacterium]TXT51086.1 MAG: histidinol dehydrogenase [Limisphaerales bacterium]